MLLAAATTIVTAMATDAWQEAKVAIARFWERVHPDRVAAIEGELAEVRDEVLAARHIRDARVEDDLAAEWARKLQRFLTNDEETDSALRRELQRVLDQELRPLLSPSEQSRIAQLSISATASGHARVYQAGRDQHIGGK